jgi:NAD/NADP transhydrogenase alpha subunit
MGGVGRRIEEAIELIEMEIRHAAAYVNDAVIPQVRAESITALRSAAEAMRKFADKLDQPPPPPPQAPRS